MLIDSHCHLDYSPLYENLDDVLKRANNADVQFFLAISTTIKSFEKIKLIIKNMKKFSVLWEFIHMKLRSAKI